MSPVLRDFLQAYADWAYFDKPSPYPFIAGAGLCNAALVYGFHGSNNFGFTLSRWLTQAFVAEGLNSEYPFGKEDYNSRPDLRTCPKRRAWVLAKLEADA